MKPKLKPKLKPASIPATDVPEQRLQHNGEVFNIHGGWLEEGGRKDNSKLGWLLLGFLLGCVPVLVPLCSTRSFGKKGNGKQDIETWLTNQSG